MKLTNPSISCRRSSSPSLPSGFVVISFTSGICDGMMPPRMAPVHIHRTPATPEDAHGQVGRTDERTPLVILEVDLATEVLVAANAAGTLEGLGMFVGR